MIILHTEHFTIRDHLETDLKVMHTLLSNEKAMYYLPEIKTHNMRDSKKNLRIALEAVGQKPREKYFFAIETRDGAYIGEIGFTVETRSPQGNIVNLGYFILPEYWGKGVVTEAALAVIHFAFEEAGVIKITTGCIKDNIGSERVMQKLGMTREAYFKKHVWHDNQYKDRVEYGLLSTEWQLMKNGLSKLS